MAQAPCAAVPAAAARFFPITAIVAFRASVGLNSISPVLALLDEHSLQLGHVASSSATASTSSWLPAALIASTTWAIPASILAGRQVGRGRLAIWREASYHRDQRVPWGEPALRIGRFRWGVRHLRSLPEGRQGARRAAERGPDRNRARPGPFIPRLGPG
jgi:hypothetical protein